MRNAHPRYLCYPSVVCVGKETTVRIFPHDVSRRFSAEKEYQLKILGLQEDQLDYHEPLALDYPCKVESGCLVFTYAFDMEQQYTVMFCEKGGKPTKISMYAVKEDLYALRPLKGDLHTHSWYSDGQDGVSMTPADYREEGFDFFSLTDHNRMYTSQLAADLYDGVPLGMHIMRGEEVHTPGSMLHIVHVGGKESVCDRYIHHREEFEAEVAEVEKGLTHVCEQYRHRVAMAKWACESIRKAGGLAIFAHPCWMPRRYNVTDEFRDILFDEKIFDAFELLNGIHCRYNNMQVALWQEQALKGNALPIVGSSDSHNHDSDTDGFAHRFTLVFAKENDTESILSAIRKGYSVAGEHPKGDQHEVRFYGSLRLVRFAHFLYDNYFNETWRLCVGEGILMRRYAQGEDVAESLAALADSVENFYKKYYGITPVEGLEPRVQTFLDRCLDAQRTLGPATKGSFITIYGGNERRE
ncbi:MAG: hypothetical protein IJC19_03810 [Clostridia bacterium]|nr:hypothetical protein [Clostridia bacterium]